MNGKELDELTVYLRGCVQAKIITEDEYKLAIRRAIGIEPAFKTAQHNTNNTQYRRSESILSPEPRRHVPMLEYLGLVPTPPYGGGTADTPLRQW